MSQLEMVDLDSLLASTHPYRRFQAYLPNPTEAFADVRQLKGADGYGVERLFRCLLLQFMEDLSDREMERYLEENLAAKWFCGFTVSEPTPDYSLFTRDRWYTHLRAPYERVFAQRPKRVRYRGVAKNQFSAFLQALTFNLKRLVVLDADLVLA